MKTNPLDQLERICRQSLSRVAKLNKSFKKFFVETMICFLSIPGRINFSQMARYGSSCESRFRQNFKKKFEWTKFNTAFACQSEGHLRAIAIEPCFIPKSGEKTPGLANISFVTGLDRLAFDLVSRLRDDARLRYLYDGPKTKKRGCPKTFDGSVDVNNLRSDKFSVSTVDDGDTKVTVYHAKLYAVCLKRVVGVAIAVYDDKDKKTQTRKIFFSPDLSLNGEQFTGLADCQARNEKTIVLRRKNRRLIIKNLTNYCFYIRRILSVS